MEHPFANRLGLEVVEQDEGYSLLTLTLNPEWHHNPHGVAHGAVLYSLADTGMGAALYPTLNPGQSCATIEIKINYFRPAVAGRLRCETRLINKGRTIANLESRLLLDSKLIAHANGNFAIMKQSR